jgi:NAD(P)H-hydrate epimerase
VILSHSTLAKEWAQKLNCTILLKHVPSIITDGDFSIWNIGGNPGMATAGSGDVLTGIISALLAQCLEPLDSAAVGAYLHSKAGDEFAQNNSEISLTASDIINDLDKVMKAYEN